MEKLRIKDLLHNPLSTNRGHGPIRSPILKGILHYKAKSFPKLQAKKEEVAGINET